MKALTFTRAGALPFSRWTRDDVARAMRRARKHSRMLRFNTAQGKMYQAADMPEAVYTFLVAEFQ